MKKIMERAWEICKMAVILYGGKAKQYFAESLRMAWAEIKGTAKKEAFKGYAKIGAWTFKLWEKSDKKRIYVSFNGKSNGYIDLVNGCETNCRYAIEDAMMQLFLISYAV